MQEEKTKSLLVGIDHGYKNIKTANVVFPTAIAEIKEKATGLRDILEYNGKTYSLNAEQLHINDNKDKTQTEWFYLLTLVAIAKEMKIKGLTKAKITLATGLPLIWYANQHDKFRAYLKANKEVSFKYEGITYHIQIVACRVYIQGYAAIISELNKYPTNTVLVDIGGGTVVIIPLKNGKPLLDESTMDSKACNYAIRKIIQDSKGALLSGIDEDEIQRVILNGRQETNDERIRFIQEKLEAYSKKIFNLLEDLDFSPDFTPTVFVGGGARIIKNFGKYNSQTTSFVLDLNANAKGYEEFERMLRKRG